MAIINLIFVAIFGLIIGSFLNCLAWRLNAGKSIWAKHSICPKCQHELGFLDLVPIASFCCLGGKCRYCQHKISWQYPAVEALTALVFVLLYFKFGLTWLFLASLINASFLIIIFIYDLKHSLVLDVVSLPAIALAISFVLLFKTGFIIHLLAAIIGAGFFGSQYLLSRGRWVGGGDIRLGFLMGMLLGWPQVLVAIFLAYLAGAVVGVGLLATGVKKMKSEVPFGAFLVPATIIAILFGSSILVWYWQLLLW